MDGIVITTLQGTGYFQSLIRRFFEQGKVSVEAQEAIFEEEQEEERKRIQPIYNSKGKLIEYDYLGRYVNIFV
ncbi:MAG TPA: hypothetical protein VMC80_01505 [Patescibacteria group bacterium]|nr:hypothetical protein [Patescibacteria group bacterium]